MGGREMRIHPRIEANAYIDYTGEEVLLFHEIKNISLGGLSIVSPLVERPQTTVELLIHFPDEDTQIECLGEVVWSHEDEEGIMGIKFINLNELQKSQLKSFLSKVDMSYVEK